MRRLPAALLPIGIAAIVGGLGLVHSRIAVPSYTFGGARLSWSVGFAAMLWLAAYAVGLPDVPRLRRQVVAASVAASMLGTLAIAFAQTVVGAPLLPRMVVFGTVVASSGWFLVVAKLSRWSRRVVDERDRVVVVGEAESVAQLRAELDTARSRPVLVATADPAEMTPSPVSPAPLVGTADDAGATVIVLDRTAQMNQGIVDQAALLHESGIRVRTLSLFYEQWLDRLPVSELERVSLMFDIGELHRQRYARRKRILDVTVALAGLPLLVALVPIVWLGNRAGNRGALLFRQPRVGKGGREFDILKFRTMSGPCFGAGEWTDDDDPRITRFGRVLRRTHVDELPQLVNILRGEVSVVGPRPEQPHYVRELAAKLPYYDLRHLVQPGLTGWAQVNQGYAASDADALEKLQYEFWYLRHQSLAMDLRILFRTVRSVVRGRGR